MERVKALINTLQQQSQQNAGPAVLLSILQQIQLELTGGVIAEPRHLGTAKVAVVMPNHSRFMPPVQEAAAVIKAPAGHASEEAVMVKKEMAVVYEPAPPVPEKKELGGWLFDPMKEIPTLTQQVNGKELNDTIGHSGTSLNDTLKSAKTELAEMLIDTPIRDLKKGIGINDRYVFLNELFRGDDPMYERSIKTINGFRILAEAEYWIERELKVKLGWDDGKSTTQHFYQLVKRRFS
ncbi:MAG: hypothetical protein ABIQ88_06955 [Chitinophagaceae bacterium]